MILSPDVSALIEKLRREIASLLAENAALKQEVSDLRRRLDKTWTGAETFATLRSVLSTARKQGLNSLQTLIAPAATLIQDLSG